MELNLSAPGHAATEILESIHDGFVFYDTDQIIRYWNRCAESLIGITRAQAIGQNVWACFPEEVGHEFHKRYTEAMRTQQPDAFEGYLGRTDSWFEVNAYPSQYGIAIFFRDVTERHKRQVELEEVRTRFNYVLKATSEAISDVNWKTQTSYWHGDNYSKLFGYTDPNIGAAANNWSQFVHPDDLPGIMAQFNKAIESGDELFSCQYRFRRADDSYAIVKDRSYIIRDSSGATIRIIAAMEDVTEMEQAKQSLLESREDYERLFTMAPLPQCICLRRNLRIIKVNDAALELYGYSREEFLTMTPFDFSAPSDHAAVSEGIRQLEMGGQLKSILRHRVKSGEQIVIELSAKSVTYDNESCLLVTVNDITYERKLEQNISLLKVSAQKMVTRAQINAQEQEREELGRELHDNINQQLTTIKLYIDLARSRADLVPQLLEKSETLLQGAINGIRSLSKNLVSPMFEEQEFGHALSDLCLAFETAAGFSILLEVGASIEDRELALTFYRVVQEQLTNISKYAAAKQAWVNLAEDEHGYMLTIRDDGRGFDPRQRKTGIGLTNIANRIELFNGKMQLDAAPGAGCTLIATVPHHAPESGSLYIAIADDDADDRELLEAIFRDIVPDCHLHFAESGIQLLDQLRSNMDTTPDLVVIDQNMPLLNGLDTLQALNLDPRFRRVPKVLYSTSIRAADITGVFATAYIEKASDPKGIEDNIRQMLLLVRGRKL
jgi:PAS domain S-box-containing protein